MQQVEIRIKGQINRNWSNWLGGLKIAHTSDGNTILSGPLRDQAALYGVLSQLSKLGLPLNYVSCKSMISGEGDKEDST